MGELAKLASSEGISEQKLQRALSQGRAVILGRQDKDLKRIVVGECASIKLNVNVGTSRDHDDPEEEIRKAQIALKYGADTLMDLSTGRDLGAVMDGILKLGVPVGSVPIYWAAIKHGVTNMSCDDMFNSVREHAKRGVDFMTIHAGVNLSTLERLKHTDRILEVVSRGGCFHISWMLAHSQENPFYAEFDYLLEILKEYGVGISLGDGMRPGCIRDSSDRPKFMEFICLGELVRKCREFGVQAIVEGPGHVPLDQIELCVKAMKYATDHAPLYLLGPIVTDIAPGYDHITSAIGGALAGMYGADFLCAVTPSEHLALPTLEDVKLGTIAGKIAAHAADLVRESQAERAAQWDLEMALARKSLDWENQFKLAIDPELARKIKTSRESRVGTCSMCGEYCVIKLGKGIFREFRKLK